MAVTIKDVARIAGVSHPVVSVVLHNKNSTVKVSPEVRERVLRAIRESGYIPNSAAQELKGSGLPLIGVLVNPHLSTAYFRVLQDEVLSILQLRGYEVLAARQVTDSDFERVVKEFRSRRVVGVISIGAMRTLPVSCPVVYCPHSEIPGFDIGCDTRRGSYLAAKHLLDVHGRRRIMYLTTAPKLDFFAGNKVQGISDALAEHDIRIDSENLILNDNAFKVLAALEKFHADAVFCQNDALALRLIKHLALHGIRVPEDLAVIGFDGYAYADFAGVELATVVQPIRKIAEESVTLLAHRIQAGTERFCFEERLFPACFRPGASCGCPSPLPETLSMDTDFFLSPSDRKEF